VACKLAAQPAALNREVEVALSSYLRSKAESAAKNQKEEEKVRLDDLQRQRKEQELKAAIKRQVENDLKREFDAKLTAMEQTLGERDRKIEELRAAHLVKEAEREKKVEEIRELRVKFDEDAKAQEARFQRQMESAGRDQEAKWRSLMEAT